MSKGKDDSITLAEPDSALTDLVEWEMCGYEKGEETLLVSHQRTLAQRLGREADRFLNECLDLMVLAKWNGLSEDQRLGRYR